MAHKRGMKIKGTSMHEGKRHKKHSKKTSKKGKGKK